MILPKIFYCPFCGSKETILKGVFFRGYQVFCVKCQASGPRATASNSKKVMIEQGVGSITEAAKISANQAKKSAINKWNETILDV